MSVCSTIPRCSALEQLHRGHDAAVSLARSLGPDAYQRISYCPDWTVAQVFAHLGSGAEVGMAILDAGLNQRPGPDPMPIWDRWNARPPGEMVNDFIDTNGRYLEALDRVAATDSSASRFPFHTYQIDLATHLTFRLSEPAIHTWDIRVAFQAAAEIDADAAPSWSTLTRSICSAPGPTREPRRRSDPHGSRCG
jgi:uncharacterized protein (TIGR03083 family)